MTAFTQVQGAPCWIDLSSSDVDRSVDFYRELLGWEATISGEEFGGYVMFTHDGESVAGLGAKMEGNEGPDTWATYLYSADARATAARIGEAGGANMFEPMEVPGMGTMGYAVDPTGAVIGIWQPDQHNGFEVHGTVGTAVWHELHTRNYPAAVDFYASAFGWKTQRLGNDESFRYSVLAAGEQELAGIFDASFSLAEGVPSNWQVYFGVPDTDREVGRALELGGTIVEAPVDSRYGRMAALTDATGAYFKIISVAV
ncbi:VOC family protein [Rathayibacter sp. YIM 133350]|uniref:VOC family protein n=1 Tax=Rathayibacter sp. YIM 133350 TaxID=3131992 RepID=UPI00307D6261